MKRIIFLVLVIGCLVFNHTMTVYALENGKDMSNAGTLSKKEITCIKNYIDIIRAMEYLSGPDASAIKSLMASGQYSTCELMDALKALQGKTKATHLENLLDKGVGHKKGGE